MTTVVDRANAVFRRVPTWPLYILCIAPAVWLFWQGINGALGANPVKALEHQYGELGLKFLIATLCITPLRRFAGINLLKFRRMLGLVTFFYIGAHLLVWLVLDVQAIGQIWADIIKRPYITVGMVGFAAMVPLAVTSNNRSIRALGAKWRKLHQLTYLAAILGAVHFVMLAKGWQIEPLAYLATVLALLLMRWKPKRRAKLA